MLFEGGCGYIFQSKATTKSIKNRYLICMQKEEIKWNYVQCSIKTKEHRKKNSNYNEEKAVTNVVDVNPIKSIITLYVNGQTHQLKGGIFRVNKKMTPRVHSLQETHFKYKDSQTQ